MKLVHVSLFNFDSGTFLLNDFNSLIGSIFIEVQLTEQSNLSGLSTF